MWQWWGEGDIVRDGRGSVGERQRETRREVERGK